MESAPYLVPPIKSVSSNITLKVEKMLLNRLSLHGWLYSLFPSVFRVCTKNEYKPHDYIPFFPMNVSLGFLETSCINSHIFYFVCVVIIFHWVLKFQAVVFVILYRTFIPHSRIHHSLTELMDDVT